MFDFIPLSQLRVGDSVLTLTPKLKYRVSSIIMFLDSTDSLLSGTPNDVNELRLDNGRKLAVSTEHVLFFGDFNAEESSGDDIRWRKKRKYRSSRLNAKWAKINRKRRRRHRRSWRKLRADRVEDFVQSNSTVPIYARTEIGKYVSCAEMFE